VELKIDMAGDRRVINQITDEMVMAALTKTAGDKGLARRKIIEETGQDITPAAWAMRFKRRPKLQEHADHLTAETVRNVITKVFQWAIHENDRPAGLKVFDKFAHIVGGRSQLSLTGIDKDGKDTPLSFVVEVSGVKIGVVDEGE
jgi:hypothetical protein